MTLILDWIERNGPPARRPRKNGFGTRLIDLVIERQLNGQVIRTYASEGLAVKLLVPLTHERWPSPAVSGAGGRNDVVSPGDPAAAHAASPADGLV
jgi:hypothetical protein